MIPLCHKCRHATMQDEKTYAEDPPWSLVGKILVGCTLEEKISSDVDAQSLCPLMEQTK